MLNTKNWLETVVVYLSIFLLIALTLWLVFSLPSPGKLFSDFLASDTAREIERFQVLLGMIGAAVVLAIAYVLNANRDRCQRRVYADKAARNIAHALALEATGLAETCDRHAVRMATLANTSTPPDPDQLRLQETDRLLSMTDNLALLDLPHRELTRLGTNANAGVNQIRQAMRTLEQTLANIGEHTAYQADHAAEIRKLANAYAGIALSARSNLNLFETLFRRGIATADERTPPEPASHSAIDHHLNALTANARMTASSTEPVHATA